MHIIAYIDREIVQHEVTDYVNNKEKRRIVYDMEDPREVRKAQTIFSRHKRVSRKRSAKKGSIRNFTLTNEIVVLNPKKGKKASKKPKKQIRAPENVERKDLSLLTMVSQEFSKEIRVNNIKSKKVVKRQPSKKVSKKVVKRQPSKKVSKKVVKRQPSKKVSKKVVKRQPSKKVVQEKISPKEFLKMKGVLAETEVDLEETILLRRLEEMVLENKGGQKGSRPMYVVCPYCEDAVETSPVELDSKDSTAIQRCESCGAFVKISTRSQFKQIFQPYGVSEKRFFQKVKSTQNSVADQYGNPIYSYAFRA